jgi:hypothetical protein
MPMSNGMEGGFQNMAGMMNMGGLTPGKRHVVLSLFSAQMSMMMNGMGGGMPMMNPSAVKTEASFGLQMNQ